MSVSGLPRHLQEGFDDILNAKFLSSEEGYERSDMGLNKGVANPTDLSTISSLRTSPEVVNETMLGTNYDSSPAEDISLLEINSHLADDPDDETFLNYLAETAASGEDLDYNEFVTSPTSNTYLASPYENNDLYSVKFARAAGLKVVFLNSKKKKRKSKSPEKKKKKSKSPEKKKSKSPKKRKAKSPPKEKSQAVSPKKRKAPSVKPPKRKAPTSQKRRKSSAKKVHFKDD